MCGVAGFWSRTGRYPAAEETATAMAAAMVHRGPDDCGVWVEQRHAVALAHRRLAVVDLSDAGHQPMTSVSGRYVMVFNGEIYNHADLRADLSAREQAPLWRGRSDTETLLAAIEEWGLRAALQRCVGMFALALWDREDQQLALARDRLGEKPFYYGWQNGVFLFASELKALRVHPAFDSRIDRNALCSFLSHNAVASPHCIYAGLRKLAPGHIATLTARDAAGAEPHTTPYWSLTDVLPGPADDVPRTDDPESCIGDLEARLMRSVGRQMIADVPLGAFLSGGIDSSLIVAMMQAQSARPIKTFSIGFQSDNFNEAVLAKSVARHLGTEHTELYVEPADVMRVIPRLPSIYDEPFADSSQLPTVLVAELARREVTVALTGDGGDEVFGGYNRHFLTRRLWAGLQRVPLPLRRALARMLTVLPPRHWDSLNAAIGRFLPLKWKYMNAGERMHKLAGVLPAHGPDDIYRSFISHWDAVDQIVPGGCRPDGFADDVAGAVAGTDIETRMMVLDSVGYLPDDILCKVDRAAMSVSLETRVPFLDHEVVEHAWRLPMQMKIRDGQGKWILRELLYRHVPRELVDRPKMGFGVPIGDWLRTELRDWAEDLLEPAAMRQEGYLRPERVQSLWREHLSGRRNWQYHLWDVLVFQQWLRSQPAA